MKFNLFSMTNRRFCLFVLMCISTTVFASTKTWTGIINTDWSVSTNWSDNTVPLAIDDVIISAAPANQPTISAGTDALANSVEVRSGAILTIEVMGNLTINGSSYHLVTTAFYNNGTVNNSGRLLIGNISGVGAVGLFNDAIFNNNADGEIQIDRSSGYGLDNHSAASTFTNSGKITIGSLASVGQFGLTTHGNFYNNLGGEIKIDNSTTTGLSVVNGTNVLYNYAKIIIGAAAGIGSYGIQNFGNLNNGTSGEINIDNSSLAGFYIGARGNTLNNGQITIGAITSVGTSGIENNGFFDNNTGGEIRIDRTTNIALHNVGGSIINTSKIVIGNIAIVGKYGLVNNASFHNNTGGEIKIDRSTFVGLVHAGGAFTNAAKIFIGTIGNIGPLGMQSNASFNNDIDGEIKIDNFILTGLYIAFGTFTNTAKIIIGTASSVEGVGVENEGNFYNNGCSALINSLSNNSILNLNNFTNSGTIIENSSNDSDIDYNTGVIQNLNGGNFIVSGNQPLNTILTNTTCNLANGSIKITGLHANISYTLSYTVSGTATVLSPTPISNANGEITIANLSVGDYTLTLGGDCLPVNLTLPASLSNSGPPPSQTVTENITSGSALIQAGTITATNQVFNASVEYKGSQSVILLPGFQATGNYFKATIDSGCN